MSVCLSLSVVLVSVCRQLQSKSPVEELEGLIAAPLRGSLLFLDRIETGTALAYSKCISSSVERYTEP